MELFNISAFLYLISTVTVNCQTEVLMFIAYPGKPTNGSLLRCGVTQEMNCTALDIFAPNPRNPVYDYVGDHVYWTDSHLNTTCRVSSDGTNYEVWIDNLKNFGGLTVDPLRRFGFLKANSSLLRFSLETKTLTVVDSSEKPGNLAIDVEKRKLFSAQTHSIEMMDYNGKQRELLVTTYSYQANFVYDAEGENLIYSNSGKLILLNMLNRTLRVIDNHHYYITISILQNIIYNHNKYSSLDEVNRVLTNGTRLPEIKLNNGLSGSLTMAVFRKYDSHSRTSIGNVSCGHCYDNSLCNVTTRACLRGCDPGWQGDTCLAACPRGRYGRNCTERCGQCGGDISCDPVSGTCSAGCRTGWIGRLCDRACSGGQYGSDCMQTCGHCYNDQTCRKSDGKCEGGCDPGWTGTTCKSACLSGQYGDFCDFFCGQCKVGTECEKTTGLCPEGCKPGWTGPKCDTACSNGQYGSDCMMTCGHCYNGDACIKSDGTCVKGCDPGWNGKICKSVCQSGRYGRRCYASCGQCKVGTECEKTTGLCPEGCKPGWTGPKCDTACSNGTYGSRCVFTCGYCLEGAVCENTEGACPYGCQSGWTGLRCDTTTKSVDLHSKLDVIFGLLAITILALILALVRLWSEKRCSRTTSHKQNIEEIAMVARSNPQYQVGAGGERKGTSGADKRGGKEEDIYENEKMTLSKLGEEEQVEEAVYETF